MKNILINEIKKSNGIEDLSVEDLDDLFDIEVFNFVLYNLEIILDLFLICTAVFSGEIYFNKIHF